MGDSPGVASHLLRWVTTFEFARSVTSYRDLQDGRLLWRILCETDPEYFNGELPEPNASSTDNWIQRWQNRESSIKARVGRGKKMQSKHGSNILAVVKHIEKLVTTFIRDEREKIPEMSKRMSPDLKAAAIDGSNEDSIQVRECQLDRMSKQLADATVQLLKLVFLAAVYSPHSNKRTVEKLSSLGQTASSEIASWIQNLEVQDQRLADSASQGPGSDAGGVLSPNRNGPSPEPDVGRDRDLYWEEQLIGANSTIKTQRDKISTLNHLLEQRKKEQYSTEDELNELRARIEKGGASDVSHEAIDQLRKKAAEDRDYIEEVEAENHSLRERNEDMDSKLARYKGDLEQKTKLRDELQMTKVERDDYMQKAKAAENLRKKIQTLQESNKSNASLRQELEDTQEQLRGLQRWKDKCTALQRANDENMKTIANGEQEIFDMKTTRRRIDQDLKYYQQRHEAAKDRQARDTETIAELEDKVRDLESRGNNTSAATETLDDEFSSSDKTHSELRSRLDKLERENKQLKQDAKDKLSNGIDSEEASTDSAPRQANEAFEKRFHSLEKQYLEVYQENLGLDASIKGIKLSMTDSRPFIEMRDRLHETTNKLDRSDKRLFEVESELADNKVALEAADGRLAALGDDKRASAEEVRKSADAGHEILKKENERLSTRVQSLQIQIDEKTSLLRHALSDQGRLLTEDEELRNANETRLLQEQLTQHKTKNEPEESRFVLNLAKRIEDGRRKVLEAEDKTRQVSGISTLIKTHAVNPVNATLSTLGPGLKAAPTALAVVSSPDLIGIRERMSTPTLWPTVAPLAHNEPALPTRGASLRAPRKPLALQSFVAQFLGRADSARAPKPHPSPAKGLRPLISQPSNFTAP